MSSLHGVNNCAVDFSKDSMWRSTQREDLSLDIAQITAYFTYGLAEWLDAGYQWEWQ
jgi:hypothetical protein